MIFDRVENLKKYAGSLPALADVAKALQDDAMKEDGKRVLDGDKLFYDVQTYVTHAKGAKGAEAHKEYIDVQVMLQGSERMDLSDVSVLTPKGPYVPDIQFFTGKSNGSVMLTPGWFVVLFPGEGHEPGIADPGVETVRKAVFKVKA